MKKMSEATSEERYFARVEEHFARRRGGPLVLSPKDWQLLDGWRQRGIPLPIVLRGINRAFDRFVTSGPRPDRINSLRYCEQEVETAWEEHRAAHPVADLGASPAGLPGAAHLRAVARRCRDAAAGGLPDDAATALRDAARGLEALAEAAEAGDLDARSLDRQAAEMQRRLAERLAAASGPRLEALGLPGFSPYEV